MSGKSRESSCGSRPHAPAAHTPLPAGRVSHRGVRTDWSASPRVRSVQQGSLLARCAPRVWAGARRRYGITRRRVPAPGASAPLPLFPPSLPSPWRHRERHRLHGFAFPRMSSSRSPAARSLSGLAAASRRGCSPCVAFPAPDLKRPLHPTPPLAPPTRLHFLLLLFTARLSPDPIRGPGGVVCAPIAQNSPRPTAPAQ